MTKYSQCFQDALLNYQNQSARSGYVFGWFSTFRHSRTLYPHIQTLQNDLDAAESEAEAMQILKAYFSSPRTKMNNHSFAMYLLDILSASYGHEGWEEFYPQGKQLVFYTGILYRGTLQHPDDALARGMTSGASPNIEDYANDTNMHTGVSTSKVKEIAHKYQNLVIPTHRSAFLKRGFLYEINYRGAGGIDIIETLKARGDYLTANIASHKQEVNIIGKIVPEDIVGYWDENGEYHKNDKYDPARQPEMVDSLPERLTALFPT